MNATAGGASAKGVTRKAARGVACQFSSIKARRHIDVHFFAPVGIDEHRQRQAVEDARVSGITQTDFHIHLQSGYTDRVQYAPCLIRSMHGG